MCQMRNRKANLKKDKTVYKVESLIGKKWVTPFQHKNLKRNKIIIAYPNIDVNIRGFISRGFFHCFTNKKYAIRYAKANLNLHSPKASKCRVIKVIIPAENNDVYFGIFSAWCHLPYKNSVCAKKIILTNDVVFCTK